VVRINRFSIGSALQQVARRPKCFAAKGARPENEKSTPTATNDDDAADFSPNCHVDVSKCADVAKRCIGAFSWRCQRPLMPLACRAASAHVCRVWRPKSVKSSPFCASFRLVLFSGPRQRRLLASCEAVAEKKKKKKKNSLARRRRRHKCAPRPNDVNGRVALHLDNTNSLLFSRESPKKKTVPRQTKMSFSFSKNVHWCRALVGLDQHLSASLK
jgi:hypothetical protein